MKFASPSTAVLGLLLPGVPKFYNMQKLVLLCLFLCCFQIATGQTALEDRKITISFENESIKQVLKRIQSETGIGFVYSDKKDLDRKVSGTYVSKSLKTILSDCFKGTDLEYKEIGQKITIYSSESVGLILEKGDVDDMTLSGYVYEKATGEALIGCTVYEKNTFQGTTTNNFGFYSLTLPKSLQPNTIVVSFLGYEEEQFIIEKTTKRTFYLEESATNLNEVVVLSGKDVNKATHKEIGMMKLKASEIKAIPAIAGETDVLKTITLLPGVKQGVDGSAGFYVRGGGPDQNLILLDGVPIYNPYHLWGFLSTFNADAINNIDIIKGAFPARYGGRLSSVLDITTKEGNTQEFKTSINIGLLSAKASVSAPLIKDKSSFIFSARRTYADLIIVPILRSQNSRDGQKRTEGYNFTDLNGKINFTLSDKDRLFVSGFYGRDKYYFNQIINDQQQGIHLLEDTENSQGWSNLVGSLRWNHVFGDKLFVNTTAYSSRYHYYTQRKFKRTLRDFDEVMNQTNSVDYFSTIQDLAIKQDYQLFASNQHSLRFGAGVIFHQFSPGVNSFFSETDKQTISNTDQNVDINSQEYSAYFEDDFELAQNIQINAGLHASLFNVDDKTYRSVQPRLGARILLHDKLAFKASFSRMTQYLHLLTSLGISQSSDLWVPSTANVPPEQAFQYSMGLGWDISSVWQLEVEGYYKEMKDIIEYKDGVSFLAEETSWEDKVAVGNGEAYGVEVFLKKNRGKLTGWIGYTLSWTDRLFDEINFGKRYPYRYDRRHDISMVANYKLSDKWSLNSSWVFFTGNAVTLATSGYVVYGYDGSPNSWSSFPAPSSTTGSDIWDAGLVENPVKRNNYRLPTYHRLDLTATKRTTHKKSTRELVIGLTNAYNRFNPSFYGQGSQLDIATGETIGGLYTITLFPLMPTVSYGITF